VEVLLAVDPHLRLQDVDVDLCVVALTGIEENARLVTSTMRERLEGASAHREVGPVRSRIPSQGIIASSEVPLALVLRKDSDEFVPVTVNCEVIRRQSRQSLQGVT